MYAYETNYQEILNPPCDVWEEYEKPALILDKIQEICESISKKGENSRFSEVFDMIYEYVEDNFLDYYQEADYESI